MITREFLESEIADMEQEVVKAQTFIIQAQATISAYKMLITKLGEQNAVEEVFQS